MVKLDAPVYNVVTESVLSDQTESDVLNHYVIGKDMFQSLTTK